MITDTTRLIRLSDQSYPFFLNTVRSENPNVSFAKNPSEQIVERLGYAPVKETIRPLGDVVSEGVPELIDGVWTQTWVVRQFNTEELNAQLEEAKRRLSSEVDRLREEAFALGLRYTFSDQSVGHIQLRPQDQINLHSLRLKTQGLDPEILVPFRTYENETKMVRIGELDNIVNTSLQRGETIYVVSWGLKDQIAAATDISELPILPNPLVP